MSVTSSDGRPGLVVRLTPPAVMPRRRAEDRASDSQRGLAAGTVTADRLLLRAASLGDRSAWRRLVDAYAPLVWAYALGALGSEPPAARVSEAVWLRLAEQLPEVGGGEMREWFLAVVGEEARRELRRAPYVPEQPTGDPVRLSGPGAGPSRVADL